MRKGSKTGAEGLRGPKLTTWGSTEDELLREEDGLWSEEGGNRELARTTRSLI